jgi:para-nitrobenzyl esterase
MDRRDFILKGSMAATAIGTGFNTQATARGTAPVVRTRHGLLEGFEEGGIYKCLGVPFARPPVGDLRWRAPHAPAAWSGVREAKEFSPAAYQMPIDPSFRTDRMSEDCLYLNVWTPSLSRTARQPVMVWFHGGGNIRGSASEVFTDGTNLARLGVTLVAPNYRLGVFGFLNDPELGANFAVLDHVAALQWVHDNIEAFGGDPSRVLIFGYSAGAVAVRHLLQCPEAKGLFHRCVMQSAGGESPASTTSWSSERSREATRKLFATLGTTDPAVLRAIPTERIDEVSRPLSNVPPPEGGFRTPMNLVWMPVPDEKIVMANSFTAWSPGIPVMFSCCQNEARWGLDPSKEYAPEVLRTMTKKLAGPKADEVLEILNAEGGSTLEKLDRLYTTVNWSEQAYASLRRFERDGRTLYSYLFARASPGRVKSNHLASHGTDVFYIFGNFVDNGTDGGLYDDTDQRVSREMQHAFVEFAKTGVPKRSDGANWPKFNDASQPHQTVVTDTVSFSPYRLDPLLQSLYSLR